VNGQLHVPADLPPGKDPPGTLWIGGWVGPRTGMDYVERREILPLTGLELRAFSSPVRSQSLYRLSYSGSLDQGSPTLFVGGPHWLSDKIMRAGLPNII
jgi:hypothetical protein